VLFFMTKQKIIRDKMRYSNLSSTGFIHLHNLKNPGFSRTFFILFPGVFQEYLKYIKQTVGSFFSV
jgi:uncharacterized membrane protein